MWCCLVHSVNSMFRFCRVRGPGRLSSPPPTLSLPWVVRARMGGRRKNNAQCGDRIQRNKLEYPGAERCWGQPDATVFRNRWKWGVAAHLLSCFLRLSYAWTHIIVNVSEVLGGTYTPIFDLSLVVEQTKNTKLHLTWSPGQIFGASCTIFEPDPSA